MTLNDNKSQKSLSMQPLLISKEQVTTYHNLSSLISRVILLCFSTFYFGYCLIYFSAFPTYVTIQIYGQHAAQTNFNSILVGVFTFGAIFGAGFSTLLIRYVSRKQFVLIINICAFIIEGIIQIPNAYVLLVCRVMQGVFTGCYMSIIPIYINELSPKQIVGSLGVFTQLFVVIGIVFSFGIGLAMQTAVVNAEAFYRIMVTIPVFTLIIQSLCLIFNFIPQSPNSLIGKNRSEEAKDVINMFLKEEYVEKVYRQKEKEVALQKGQIQEEKGQIKYHWSAYLIGFEIPVMQQMTGVNAIVTSAKLIVGNIAPGIASEMPLIVNAVPLITIVSAIFVLNKFGRKTITLLGNLGLGIIDIVIGILFLFSDWNPSGIIIVVLLFIYMLLFGLSAGPIVWMYVPEIIPARVVPFATMMNWLSATLVIIFSNMAINANGGNPSPIFFFYGALTLFFFVMNLILMKETKGLTTSEIAIQFNKNCS